MKITLFALILCAFYVCYAQNVLTGAQILNQGMDFRQGGLVPNSQLFTYTYNPNPQIYSPAGRPDLKFKVPKEILISAAPTDREEANSNLFKSYQEVTRHDTGLFDFGRNVDNSNFGIGARYANEYSIIQQRIREQFGTITRSLYFTREYRITTLPYLFLSLEPRLAKLLQDLPPSPRNAQDLQLYKTIVESYGAFFQWTGEYGGRVRHFHFMNAALAGRDQNWIKQQVSHSYQNDVKGSNLPVDPFFAQNVRKETVYTGGHRSANFQQWKNSIPQAPGLISGAFRPISDLVVESSKKSSFEAFILHYAATGIMELPFTAKLVNNIPKIPGYSIVGTGYDPVYMQTRLPIFEHEDLGFQNPKEWRNPFFPNLHYVVPSSMTLFQRTETVETNFTDVFMTKNEFESKFTERRTSRGFLGMSKKSREVYFYQKRVEELAFVKIELEKQISWYDLKLNPLIYFNPELMAKYMNPALKTIIDHYLGTNYEDPTVKAMYRQVIEYWGTDFILGTRMGGAYRTDISFSKELLKTYTIDIVKTQSSFSFLGFINSRSYSIKNDTRIAAWFKEHAKTELTVRGGRFSPVAPKSEKSVDNKGFAAFAETVRTDPESLSYELVPITVLFRDPIKHQNMARAVQEYREEAARGKGDLESMMPSTQKTCKSCECVAKCLPSEWNLPKVERLVEECKKNAQCLANIVGSRAAHCISKC